MKNRMSIFACALLAAALVVGCEKKEESPVKAPDSSATGSKLPDIGAVKDNVTSAANNAVSQGKELAADLTKQAEEKFKQVKDAITGGKFADADGILKSLESMKEKLPQGLQDQLAGLRKQVDDGLAKLKALGGGLK